MIFKVIQTLVIAILGSQIFALELPKNLKWETNDKEPTYADPDAQRGGTVHLPMPTFPLTMRTVGPDANTILYAGLVQMNLGLTLQHPNTDGFIPLIATHWSIAKDGKTVYYKLNPKATWSDGKPVTANDFAFTLEFMRSPNIVAPWYNNHYNTTFDRVDIFDDHTLAIVLRGAQVPILDYADLPALPRHFYGNKIDKDFVKKYNWATPPVTGPYVVAKIEKGKRVVFERQKNWWGDEFKYFKNRFNIDKIIYEVVREDKLETEYFLSGKLDFVAFKEPRDWHEMEKQKSHQMGFVNRLWGYTDTLRPERGFFLNSAKGVLKDKNVRMGIQYAMNWQKVIDTLLRKEMKRLNTIVEGAGDYTNRDIKAHPFDLKKADAFFDAAGYTKRGPDGIRVNPQGERLSATVLFGTDTFQPWLVVLREDARKAGFELNMKRLDPAALWKVADARGHDIIFAAFQGWKYPDYFGSTHSKGEDNFFSINIPELDRLNETYKSASTEKEKQEISRKIQQIVHDEAVFVPAVIADWVRGAHWRWFRFPKIPLAKNARVPVSFFDQQSGGLVWFDQKLYDETQAAMKTGTKFPPHDLIDETWRSK